MNLPPDTRWLHDRVDRFRNGDATAANELVCAVTTRLERLAQRMFRNFPGVRTGADTGDVVQGALIRLVNALRDIRPVSTRDFTGLAALQVRRELLDLARYFAVRGACLRKSDPETADYGPSKNESPADLEHWTRFHLAVDGLPENERETFGLIYYHGQTRAEASLLLGVSERTVYRWWASACVLLCDRLGGELPL